MAEECMEVENTNDAKRQILDTNQMIEHLIKSEDAYFKSQQRDEAELSSKQKQEIAETILAKSKANFLARFGKNLKQEHLEYFTAYVNDENEGYEINFYLSDLKRYFTKTKRETDIRNRRYDALKKLIDANNYFSETEMMKRNPLLYDQLVGRYLSEEERKTRDNIDTKNITFVNLLLESIDRDTTRKRQKQQQDDEDCAMEEVEEEDSASEDEDVQKGLKESVDDNSWDDEIPSTSRWGGFEDEEPEPEPPISRFNFNPHTLLAGAEPRKDIVMITATERQLLKEEFKSVMYQNFLDGNDVDFDYTLVDDNDAYDNFEIKTHDAEESYFDSEAPQTAVTDDDKMAASNETSEDELDVFMDRLNQHHTLQLLSEGVKKL
ncbi:uncharacterized protein CBL_10465 [Carabus blaptoides fortunei]